MMTMIVIMIMMMIITILIIIAVIIITIMILNNKDLKVVLFKVLTFSFFRPSQVFWHPEG